MNKEKMQIKEDKLKPLIPTLREKKRFVKIRVIGSKKFEFKEFSNNLNTELTYYIGAIDFGKGGIWILKDKFNFDKQEAIIKVGIKYKEKLLASLSLINKLGNSEIKIETLRVSGNLKGVDKN
jgi:RNase P/RNase MRP subunit POP5